MLCEAFKSDFGYLSYLTGRARIISGLSKTVKRGLATNQLPSRPALVSKYDKPRSDCQQQPSVETHPSKGLAGRCRDIRRSASRSSRNPYRLSRRTGEQRSLLTPYSHLSACPRPTQAQRVGCGRIIVPSQATSTTLKEHRMLTLPGVVGRAQDAKDPRHNYPMRPLHPAVVGRRRAIPLRACRGSGIARSGWEARQSAGTNDLSGLQESSW